MSERYEMLYGSAAGTWALINGPVGTISPPYIDGLVMLGGPSSVLTQLWNRLVERPWVGNRRHVPPAQRILAEQLGVNQQTVSLYAAGKATPGRRSDEFYTALVRLWFDPQPLLDRCASLDREQAEAAAAEQQAPA